MPDIEKVMSGLEGLTWDDWSEYNSNSEVQNIAKDTLELLKEQQKELERLKKCRNDCKIDCLLEKYEALLDERGIVRCKDCKYSLSNSRFCAHPHKINNIQPGDWFCADGERK